MADAFILLDLVSQGAAVQRTLVGQTEDEKLAWLGSRGTLTLLHGNREDGGRLYRFESTTGQWCCFFFRGDQIVFLGDNSTFTPHDFSAEACDTVVPPPRSVQVWVHVTLAMACLASMHFLIAVALWGVFVALAIRQGDPILPMLRGSLPVMGLLVMFIVSTVAQAKQFHRLGRHLLLAGLALTIALFLHDVTTHNWQMHYENYHKDAPQRTFIYATWWWYDEAWFNVR